MDNGASSYRRFLDGDDAGMVEIIRDYKDGLMLYLNGLVADIHLAEELMEQTFFKLVTRRPRYTGKCSFKTWLYTIGRNAAIDCLRRRRWVSDAPLEDYAGSLAAEESVERAYLQEEQKIALHQALRGLKAEHRQALYLVYFEGFTNAEAATAMGKSRHQMENLISRARAALKTQLDKEGFVYEELR